MLIVYIVEDLYSNHGLEDASNKLCKHSIPMSLKALGFFSSWFSNKQFKTSISLPILFEPQLHFKSAISIIHILK